MKIGIVGGTFNPPHLGHLALARTVLDLGLVDRAMLLPASVPPHKAAPTESTADRLAMTILLASEDERIDVDDIELARSGPSFTIDTVRQLTAARPNDSFRLVIGSDMAKSFGSWRSYQDLLRSAPPLSAERPDDVFANPPGGPAPLHDFPRLTAGEAEIIWRGRFPMKPIDISSTKIRDLVASGADDGVLLSCVTKPVLAYIRDHELYRP